jgi:hypothetical protein
MNNKHLDTIIVSYLEEHTKLLPCSGELISPMDCEVRASRLLIAKAYLSQKRLEHLAELSRESTIEIMRYNEAMNNAQGKVTEKKAVAEANKDYTDAREAKEDRDNFIKYLSAMIEVYEQGHIHLRQMAARMMMK